MTVESLIVILLLQVLALAKAVRQPPPGRTNGLGWVHVGDEGDPGDSVVHVDGYVGGGRW